MNSRSSQQPHRSPAPVYGHPLPTWKRVLDVACTSLALLVIMPVFGAVALYITLVSPGPILFRQTRVGLRGTNFLCFKFRTMKVRAETNSHETYFKGLMESNAPMMKMDARGDSRLIPGGWLLRALGIDELPQLLNVLRGEMSLVGPRPCIQYEYDGYQPWQKERFASVPGLTGLWQVSGKNRTTFDQMIRLDIRYAQSKSFWGDIKILALTIPAIVQQYLDTKRSRVAPATPAPAAAPERSAERYHAGTLVS